MALSVQEASSSYSTTKSNSTPKWKFHVFLSFRGEDTRHSFTDHLYAALCRKGIKAYRDDEEVERGEVISEELLKAIEESLFAIVVVSKNYASSSWCLDELQKILASKKELGQQILPIFYGVDPSDVRHQKGSFAEAFIKHEEKFREDQEKVRRWRDSLTEVANLSGWDSKGWHESELIEKVAEQLWNKLRCRLPSYNDTLIGIDKRVEEMDSHFGIGLDDVRFVGMWGMGGIGKTTLARVIYERFHDQFDLCCFLANIREISQRDGQVHLQRRLISHLKIRNLEIGDTYEGKNVILNLFCNRKVLLILDDVSSLSQLQNLAESQDWFGAGSRVIITTRDLHLLISHGVHEIYEVKTMTNVESLQLFSRKAFRSDQPKEDFLELSKSAVEHAGGLPLALHVLGSFLRGRSVAQWEDTLDRLKEAPSNEILEILRISYDALEDAEKRIFLDIACFFKGWGKIEVTQILKNCGLHPIIGISLLVEKSLLTEIKRDNIELIDMHDLVQEMGWNIVSEESPYDAGKRSRLWSKEDIDEVLKRNTGTKLIQGIILHTERPYEAHWDPKAFSNMRNLRLLIILSTLHLPRGLKCLSSTLKVLHWRDYPLENLPLGTQVDKLVDVRMHYSKLKQLWNERQHLENLKFLELNHSKYLIKTPTFFGLPNLERLELEGCTNLVELHPSLGQHKKLLKLNLKGCTNLKLLPRKLEMNSLKEFVLFGCTQIRNLPEFGENMENLITLDAGETNIAKLPMSLGSLTSLEALKLRGCKNLVCLPHNIHNLKHLKILDTSGCSKLSTLPENLNENEALETLDLSGTAITEVPSSIGHFEKLKSLSFQGCKGPTSNSWILSLPWNNIFRSLSLPASIFNLKSLTELDLSYCNIDDGFIPEDLDGLSSLNKLDLSGNQFLNLPTCCISNLLKLEILFLNFCPRLQSLPQPSPGLGLIKAEGCASMETLSDEQLVHLFALINERGRFAQGLCYMGLDADLLASLSMETLSTTIPGTQMPSWFENQTYLSLNEKGKASVTIDIPPCEWLGFVLCVVLDDIFYPTEASKRRLISPCWDYYISRASESAFAMIGGNLVYVEKGISYPHLWILVAQIREKNGVELSKKYSQLRLLFTADFGFSDWAKERKIDGIISVKCGWRVISKVDFESHLSILEEHKGEENGMCFTAKEQKQCLKSLMESSQAMISECETKSSETSSPCSEEEGKLDDSWMQFISDDARFWF